MKFYFGVWIPFAASWMIVVVVAALVLNPVALGVGVALAIFGPIAALAVGAWMSRDDQKGSWSFVAHHREMTEHQLMRLGLKKGCVLGPATVLGVAFFGFLPFAVDHILTALGR